MTPKEKAFKILETASFKMNTQKLAVNSSNKSIESSLPPTAFIGTWSSGSMYAGRMMLYSE